MEQFAPWIAPVTIAFAIVGALLVLWLTSRTRRVEKRAGGEQRDGTLQMACTVCQKEMVVHRNGMAPLSGPECALVARTFPKSVGRKLGEHLCPYCESSHYFLLDGKHMEWLGANLYSPQTNTSLCMECRRPLRKPPWPAGAFDGRIQEAPALAPEFGLVCERCGAVCCVECCTKATRNRSKNGAYHCPRCARADVKKIFHP
ncbi:MAG: hypothetical protein HZB26_23055 [Candidatus Hydrogenedentes bacterium]|nr:hypothetical protein [Candidatus Hydrogenedentota bacterium]